jgi:hypothetical protein
MRSASVLELPAGSIYVSGTQLGDRLLIKPPDQLDQYLQLQQSESPPVGTTGT